MSVRRQAKMITPLLTTYDTNQMTNGHCYKSTLKKSPYICIKIKIMNKNSEVDTFLKQKEHPLSAQIQMIRDIILATDERIEETIKWSSPTFMYKGNIASFNFRAKKLVSLMFHNGASIKDKSGLLEGDGKLARVARFYGIDDIEKKKGDLQNIIRAWIKMQDE